VGCHKREADLSEKMNEIVSRRQTFSLLGLVAVLAAMPTAVLTVAKEAEAQPAAAPAPVGTRGMQRRQARRMARTQRRQARRTARTQRRAIRRGVTPAQ
jgi:hypothetical protein